MATGCDNSCQSRLRWKKSYAVWNVIFFLFLSICHFWCCVQYGLFHFQARDGFVSLKAVTILLG